MLKMGVGVISRLVTRKFFLLAFAISGFTALVYEIVWIRYLQLIFGSTIYAVSTLLSTFMAGYVLGAFLFRNVADNTKKPSLVFSILQGAIGIYGLLIIPMFKLLPTLYISLLEVPGSQFLQFALGFLVIIIPATLFGATWPVMNKAYIKVKVGKDAGMLYSLNSVGAVFGSIAAGFLLIPSLGLMRTSITASILNLVSASIIFLVWKRNEG